MDDLISRKAAIDRLNAIPPGNWSKARYTRELWNVPSVGAMPLDKLCEMLTEKYYCPPYPNDPASVECEQKMCKECWKAYLTKWMEEQNA